MKKISKLFCGMVFFLAAVMISADPQAYIGILLMNSGTYQDLFAVDAGNSRSPLSKGGLYPFTHEYTAYIQQKLTRDYLNSTRAGQTALYTTVLKAISYFDSPNLPADAGSFYLVTFSDDMNTAGNAADNRTAVREALARKHNGKSIISYNVRVVGWDNKYSAEDFPIIAQNVQDRIVDINDTQAMNKLLAEITTPQKGKIPITVFVLDQSQSLTSEKSKIARAVIKAVRELLTMRDDFVPIKTALHIQVGTAPDAPNHQEDEVLEYVNINGVMMDPHLITQKLYESLMHKNTSAIVNPNAPVTNISFRDGCIFCNALSKKYGLRPAYPDTSVPVPVRDTTSDGYYIPEEKVLEWAYGCGDNNAISPYFNNSGTLKAIDQYSPNKFSLYDTEDGSVRVWSSSLYKADGIDLTTKGASYSDKQVESHRAAYRTYADPSKGSNIVGLRICRPAQPGELK
jgi:hypothetical protein